MEAIFALYPHYPIACEGDDPFTDSILVEISEDQIEEVTKSLQIQFGGYVQFWGRA